ncbi:MAG: hypothetical protein RLZZ129_760 [Verrucomicrobiota bacterium]|jgi:hypothetical protein
MRVWLQILLLAATMVVSAAQAQEKEPAMKDAVRRDLEEIKAAGVQAGRERLNLPAIAGPDSQPAMVVPRPRVAAGQTRDRQETASENWLLQAMNPDGERTAEEEKLLILTGEKTETEIMLEKRFRLPREKLSQRATTDPKGRAGVAKAVETPTAVENPLTAFMGDWISPRDHELLIPKAAASVGAGPVFSQMLAVPGLELTATKGSGRTSGESIAPNRFSDNSPANPYLPPDLPSLPAARDQVSFMSEVPPAGPSLDFSPPPTRINEVPVAPTRPAPPKEILTPADDAKYFPQLRRF